MVHLEATNTPENVTINSLFVKAVQFITFIITTTISLLIYLFM